MDKLVLNDYVDACEYIKQLESEIEKLQRESIVVDKVTGSANDFPFQPTSFRIEGRSARATLKIKSRIDMLAAQRDSAEELKQEVEEWMSTIPFRMRRIVKCRFFDGMSWEDTAMTISKKRSGESVKKEFQRFMKEYS